MERCLASYSLLGLSHVCILWLPSYLCTCTLSYTTVLFVAVFPAKDKEEVTSPGGESDSNSTTTTPKTVISNQSSLPHHSPTPSLGSETSVGGSDRDRPATPKPSPRLARSVTPVSWLHCCTLHCNVTACGVFHDLSLSSDYVYQLLSCDAYRLIDPVLLCTQCTILLFCSPTLHSFYKVLVKAIHNLFCS
jgi:hypothetical protein